MRIGIFIIATLELLLILAVLTSGMSLLLYGAAVLAVLLMVLALLSNKKSGPTAASEEGYQDINECNVQYLAVKRQLENERVAQKEHIARISELEEQLKQFARQCHRMQFATDAEQKFAGIIKEKTENATLELTNHVYSIGDWSQKVSELIKNVLGRLTSDQDGLRKQTIDLETELHQIEGLIEEFRVIKDDYIVELEKTESTMRAVDNFTDTITDLAERTNVLAINASIEAARAGQAGRGFAVIASEIQGLAGNTKKIAEEISHTIETSVQVVKESISSYGERLQNAVSKLIDSGKKHNVIIERFGPQIDKVSRVIEESEELSEEVTKNINEVTVHLQYQDSVRQVLEHMVELLEALAREGSKVASEHVRFDETELQKEAESIRSILSGLFTTREEWNAFDFELKEDVTQENTQEADGEEKEFEGDVTLF